MTLFSLHRLAKFHLFFNKNWFYKSVVEGENVTLDDVDNLEIYYEIVEYYLEHLVGEAVTLSDSAAAVPTFTAPLVDKKSHKEIKGLLRKDFVQ